MAILSALYRHGLLSPMLLYLVAIPLHEASPTTTSATGRASTYAFSNITVPGSSLAVSVKRTGISSTGDVGADPATSLAKRMNNHPPPPAGVRSFHTAPGGAHGGGAGVQSNDAQMMHLQGLGAKVAEWPNLPPGLLTMQLRQIRAIPDDEEAPSSFTPFLDGDNPDVGWAKVAAVINQQISFEQGGICPIASALRGLHLNMDPYGAGAAEGQDGGKSMISDWKQSLPWNLDGDHGAPSDVQVKNIYNPSEGVIYSLSGITRDETLLYSHPMNTRPIKTRSDVTALEYSRHAATAGEQATPLRYLFFVKIQDEPTRRAINSALSNNPDILAVPPTWSQRKDNTAATHLARQATFGCTSASKPESLALLGTSVATRVAMLLMQHRQIIGWKRIKRISVFRDDGVSTTGRNPDKIHHSYEGPSMFFELADVPYSRRTVKDVKVTSKRPAPDDDESKKKSRKKSKKKGGTGSLGVGSDAGPVGVHKRADHQTSNVGSWRPAGPGSGPPPVPNPAAGSSGGGSSGGGSIAPVLTEEQRHEMDTLRDKGIMYRD